MIQKINTLFTNNWISKLVSLFLAAVIWFTIFSYLEKNKDFPVPGPEGFFPTGEDPKPEQIPIPKVPSANPNP